MENNFIIGFIGDVLELTNKNKLNWNLVEKTTNNHRVIIPCLKEHEKSNMCITIGINGTRPEILFFLLEYGKMTKNIPSKPESSIYVTTPQENTEISILMSKLYSQVYTRHINKLIPKTDKEFLISMVKQIKTSKN